MQVCRSPVAPSAEILGLLEQGGAHLSPRRREEARGIADRLRTQRFRLALLGEFKRGKSTLGNALLESGVLPVGVLPTTAIPTLARYDDTPSARVRLRSGEVRPISLSELAEFSTEKGNPENVKDVALVEVSLPAPMLRSMDLLDSPGTGSAHRHNTESALAALGEIDAAVVVLACDQPAGEAEIGFLQHLRGHVARFYFVLNRADLLSPGELAEAVDFVRTTLARHGFSNAEIFPLSARAAAEGRPDSGFDRFRNELTRFLQHEREQARIGGVRTKLARLVSEDLFELRLMENAARLEASERERRIALLREAIDRGRSRRGDRHAILKGRLERLLSAYDDEFAVFRKSAVHEAPHQIGAADARLKELSNRDYDRELRSIVESHSADRFRCFMDDARAAFTKGLEEIVTLVREETSGLTQEVYRTIGEAFQIAPPPPVEPELPESERFDFTSLAVRCSLEATTDFLVLHFPRPAARKLLRRRAAAQAEDFYERNGGRLRFELLTKGESFLRRSLAAALELEDELARRFEHFLQDPGPAEPTLAERIRSLAGLLDRVKEA